MRTSARGAIMVISAALVVGVSASVASATSTSAAASARWRIVKTFGCGQGGLSSVTSTGPRGAWTAGLFTPCSPHAYAHVLVARWDGRTWQQPPLSPGFARIEAPQVVAALSDSYSWTFGDGEFGPFAFLYDGGRWRTFQPPDAPAVSSAVVFSRSNAWAFGERFVDGQGYEPYVARFNGRSWRRVWIPVLPTATASPAPSNIWAIGPVARGGWALAHWTGRWQEVRLPDPPSGKAIDTAWIDWDNAAGAWVVADLVPTVPNGSRGGLLLHWTGSRWIKITYPFQTCGFGPVAHDGHGGLWIASAPRGSCRDTDMVHYSPAHGWSKPVPAGHVMIQAMRLIPGTRSVLAVGAGPLTLPHSEGPAVILKYGP